MSSEKTKTTRSSRNSFSNLQTQIEEFRKKRDDLNQKTKYYINQLQEIDNNIEKTSRMAKENYKKKRDYWNEKVKKLKEKKLEYKKILDGCIEERKKLQGKGSGSDKVISIKQIERKIDNLERRIETENLDINEENAIIDKIKELAKVKQDFLAEKQNSEIVKLEKKIQIVKINLNKIYEQLTKWSNKSQNYHVKMLEAYDNIRKLRETKKKLEEELIENKKAADSYHEQFLQAMNQRKRSSKGQKTYKPRTTQSKRPQRGPRKKDEELERIKQDKLASALEKQKAGKKLDLYEARLILEKSKG